MATKRKEQLVNGEIYHVYNKSVGDTEIFIGRRETKRALDLIDYYRFVRIMSFSKFRELSPEKVDIHFKDLKPKIKLVEILAYSIMPNHYHLLIKQIEDNGIKIYISNFQNAFAKYFNEKSDRNGSLFQTPFKAKRIENDDILLHLSRYIHLNPVTSFLIDIEFLKSYPLTSFPHYLDNEKSDFITKDIILKIIGSSKKYESFVENQVNYQRKLQLIKTYSFE